MIDERSVEAWERRAPDAWRKVIAWLAAQGVSIQKV